MRSPASGEQPGVRKLGRYECTEPLGGDGGFETYRGRVKGLTGLDRSFAVKVLRLKRSETASAIVEPFIQAAKRSAAIANPRIATVVDTGAGEGVVFAVTPFMEGLDLSHFLAAARQAGLLVTGKDDRARQWYSLVAYVGAEIARGLHAAHAQTPPLVHGALCPGNVFITSRGAVRLLDFGLRAAVRRPFEPRPRRLLPYIAPELAAPAADGTMAGDMYSLGVLLGELASGDPPPQGRRASEMQILLSTLPEDLGALIGRLVSVSPAARPSAEEAVSLLTASYADTSETSLVTALSSLVQHLASNHAQIPAPAEAEVAVDGAHEAVEEAPPPPSEVEHDDAFEASPQNRSADPVAPPPAEVADLSVPDPETVEGDLPMNADGASFDADSALSMAELSMSDVFTVDPSVATPDRPLPSPATVVAPEERFSSEPTTIGDQSLIDDLLKKSRPTEPLSRPTASRPASTHITSPEPAPVSAPLPRGPTQPGFSASGTVPLETPPPIPVAVPESTGFSSEWSAEPGVVAEVAATGDSASIGPPLQAYPAASGLPENGQLESQAAPSLVGFEAPPATWGVRALAALGGQAGIAPADEASGLGLLDQGLLDQVQSEMGSSPPLSVSPSLATPDDESPLGPQNVLVGASAMPRHQTPIALEVARPGAVATVDVPSPEDAQQRDGDALLEDHLVDAPEGMHAASSWHDNDSAMYGETDGPGMPVAGRPPFQESPSAEVAQVLASVVEQSPLPEAEAYMDEHIPLASATAPAYLDDGGEPLAVPALPAQAAGHASTIIAYAPPSSAKPTAPASQAPAAFPGWAKSPEIPKRTSRTLVWVIGGVVLCASLALGGLAGFMVGTRGKSISAVLDSARAPAARAPRAAVKPPVDDESPAAAEPAPAKATSPGKPVAAGKTHEGAKASEGAVMPKPRSGVTEAKLPEPLARALPTAKPVAKTALAEPSDKAVPADKAAKPMPAAAFAKGVADAAGSGELVSVSLVSQPEGATVWLNGKERGLTPLQVKVQSGPARVVMILAGHALAAADITASEGAKVSKQLTAIEPPLEGEARFRAECATQGKLPIVIDGKETGVLCPFSKLRVDPGVHKIGLFVPSVGAVREKEVTLRPGVRSIVFAD